MKIHRFPTRDGFSVHAAKLIAGCIQSSVAEHGDCSMSLSGGDSPRSVYARLAEPPYRDSIEWSAVSIYFGDDRAVPPDNSESNYRMASETLLGRVPIEATSVHRVHGELLPEEAARGYDSDLRSLAARQKKTVPSFDLMLLGLGADGHTASLFPGSQALKDTTDLATAVELPPTSDGARHAIWRITMTLPVINASRQIVFLVAGGDKLDALDRVASGDVSAPATLVRPKRGEAVWLVSEE